MKSLAGLLAISLASALLLAGCDKMPGAGPDTLIVDLPAIAKATGQDEAIQLQAQAAREEINARLMESAGNLEQQLDQERSNIGDAPTQEQQQQLQQMTAQAQQQYGQLQAEAQQQLQQLVFNLEMEFRDQVKPFAEDIARARKASVIHVTDQTIFWQDPAVDITGDVIAAVRAAGIFEETGASGVAGPNPPSGE